MNERHIEHLSVELRVAPQQVLATARLLEDGATIPFIARYRKEATGSLDETVVTTIRDRLAQLDHLDKRRDAILKSLEDQGKLTDELRARVLGAETLAVLEDLYLPFRPKRRTRATLAREKGLEPLARKLFDQEPGVEPTLEAEGFIDAERGVETSDEALAGARDIIAEWVSENADARTRLRALFADRGILRSRVVAGKETEGARFRDYFSKEEPVGSAPSHRVLAALRGDKEGILTVRIVVPDEEALEILQGLFVMGSSASSRQVGLAVQDGYRRLLAPSLENETMQRAKEGADREAIRIFADNLRNLLMAAPFGARKVMGIDPGFRTGCKVVCLDPQGKLLHNETIHPHTGAQAAARAVERVRALIAAFAPDAIAVGNGTGGRETESFLRGLGLPGAIQLVMVDESGASVYSASEAAREEFPDQDVTVRGAVSIGRRFMDPLAELVKIDPKAIGVGQYQHDVDQAELKKGLEDVVASCVNRVGVEVNTASAQLLGYVSGLGPQLARNIVSHRNENGPFRSREALKKVARLGPKGFQQAAGFLRIRDGENPLDASAVHPESYGVVAAIARDLGRSVPDLMRDADLRKAIDLNRYVTDQVGIPTLRDILSELAKPGRDPRERFEAFSFAEGIESLEDLAAGMRLPGVVTNVTAFGAFVDIGVHRDGLVHVSELSDDYVSDPRQVVRVHQHVTVIVLDVDKERGRIGLSMKSSAESRQTAPPTSEQALKPSGPDRPPGRKVASPRKPAFNNPFEEAFKKR